jgi:hypothetical protein
MSIQEIVYIAEDETKYTKGNIEKEINEFIESRYIKSFDNLNKELLAMVLYNYVLGILTWEHPNTILNQIDKDEEKAIIEMYNRH